MGKVLFIRQVFHSRKFAVSSYESMGPRNPVAGAQAELVGRNAHGDTAFASKCSSRFNTSLMIPFFQIYNGSVGLC